MGQVTHEQAELMLKLYELRREARLRQARAWFMDEFNVTTVEEFQTKYLPGSEENISFRMVVSYWEMCANIVNRGLIDEEFFFENQGEQWLVFEKVKPVLLGWRAAFKNPLILANLEEHCKRLEAWREKRAPGSTEAMRQMFQQMAKARAAQAGASA